PGHVDDHVDQIRSGEQEGILGDHRNAGGDGLVELPLGVDVNDAGLAGIGEYVATALRLPTVYSHDPHSGNAVAYLIGKPLDHEARAEKADTEWFPRVMTNFQ